MATIGGITCTFVKGQGQSLTPRMELWNRPGMNGYGAMELGNGDSPFVFRAVGYALNAAVTTWINSLQALKGSVVTIVDDFGTTWASMLVTSSTIVSRTPRVNHDGNGDVRGEVQVEGVKIV